jgi:hypothetical protein
MTSALLTESFLSRAGLARASSFFHPHDFKGEGFLMSVNVLGEAWALGDGSGKTAGTSRGRLAVGMREFYII